MAIQSFIDENGEEWFYNDKISENEFREATRFISACFEIRDFEKNRIKLNEIKLFNLN